MPGLGDDLINKKMKMAVEAYEKYLRENQSLTFFDNQIEQWKSLTNVL